MVYYLGIDIGSNYTKAAIVDGYKKIIALKTIPSQINFTQSAQQVVKKIMDEVKIDSTQIKRTVATGYGRRNLSIPSMNKTEIFCHGKGVYHFFQKRATIIDIGGQDCKVIKISAEGQVDSFQMNRKCAAGTGAFLEEMARRVGIDPKDMSAQAQKSTQDIRLNSFCTVFAMTELLKLIRENISLPDIIKGIYLSVICRIEEMDTLVEPIVLTGGVVAHHPQIVPIFYAYLKKTVLTLPHSQEIGAIGAAFYAVET